MKRDGNRLLYPLAVMGGVFLSVLYVNPYGGEIALSELVLQLSGSRGKFALAYSVSELVSFFMRMAPAWIFEVYMGIELYRHFCTASIYVFSRCTNRMKWYQRELVSLGRKVLRFQAVLLCFVIVVTALRYQVQFDFAGMVLLLYHFFLHSLWLWAGTILINLLALRVGSSMSFTIVMMMQMLCVALWGLNERLGLFLHVNPVSHIVLGWHSSCINVVNAALNPPYKGFYLEESVLFYLVINMIIATVGAILVCRRDVLISDSEMGVL